MAVILEYQLNGVDHAITQQKQLADLTKQYKKELAGLDVGTKKYNELNTVVNKLKNSQQDLTKKDKELQRQLRVGAEGAKKNFHSLSNEVTLLTNKYYQLTQAERRSPFGRQLARDIRTANAEMRSIRGEIGKTAGLLGGFGRQTLAAFGFTGAAFLLARGVQNNIQGLIDYQKANSKLNSILGKTSEETATLRQEQVRLASTTAFNTEQTVEMQTEMAKLGFTMDEIVKSGGGVTKFAIATQSEIPRAAALAGAALRSFNLDAREMDRVVSALAISTTKSALDFSKLETALPIVAASAKASGVSLEQLLGRLAVLSDRGIDASTAATSLRNIFIDLTKHGLTYDQAMAKINGSTNKLETAFKLFNKRGANVAAVLAENTERAEELGGELVGVQDLLQEMVDEQLNNFAGALIIAESQWDAMVKSLGNSATPLGNLATFFVKFTGDIFGFIRAINDGQITLSEFFSGRTSFGSLVTEFGRIREEIKDLQDQYDDTTNTFDRLNIKIDIYTKGIEAAQNRIRELDLKEGSAAWQKYTDFIKDAREELDRLHRDLDNFDPAVPEIIRKPFGGNDLIVTIFSESTAEHEQYTEEYINEEKRLTDKLNTEEVERLAKQTEAAEKKRKKLLAQQKKEQEEYLKQLKEFQMQVANANAEEISQRIERTIDGRPVPRLAPSPGGVSRARTAPQDVKPLSEEMRELVGLLERGAIGAETFQKKLEELRLKAEQSQLRRDLLAGGLKGEDQLAAIERYNEIEILLNEEKNERIKQQEEETAKEIERIKEDSQQKAFELLQSFVDRRYQSELDAINAERDARIEAARVSYEQKVKVAGNSQAIQKRLEEDYNKEVERINKEASKKRVDAEVKATLRAGLLAGIQALANTTLPFPASLAALIPVGLATAAAVADIKATGYAHGGFTEPIGEGKPDHTGEVPVGNAHAGEWYMPRPVLQTSEGRAIAEKGERLRIRMGYRSNRQPGFAEGGFTTGQPYSVPGGITGGLNVTVKIEEESIERQAQTIARRTATETADALLNALQEDIRRREREGRTNTQV